MRTRSKEFIIVIVLLISISLIYVFTSTSNQSNQQQTTIPRSPFTTTQLSPTSTRAHGLINGSQPITASVYDEMLGVGINVDWLTFSRIEHYYFYWRSRGVNVAEYFKREGFSNVRIRVDGDIVSNKTYLRMLGEVVEDCLRAGLIPIIAYSANELRYKPTDPGVIKHFVEWWATAARYFKGKSYLISFDLIIETSGPITNYVYELNKIYNETIAAIRSIDKYRIIIVTAPHCSSPFYLKYLKLPKDPYIIAEWHIYAKGPCPRRCNSCACTAPEPVFDKTLISRAVEAAVNWSRETGIPLWMGAWKPNCYPKHCKETLPDGAPKPLFPPQKALVFVKYMVTQLRQHGIPYDINADQLFFNIEKLEWYPSQKSIIEAVLSG